MFPTSFPPRFLACWNTYTHSRHAVPTHSFTHNLYLIISKLEAKLARRDEIGLLKSNRKDDEQTFDGFDNDETDAQFDALGFEFECEDTPEHGKNDVDGVLLKFPVDIVLLMMMIIFGSINY